MKIAFLCAALVAVPALSGELVAYEGRDTIRLVETACANKAVLSYLDPSIQPEFHAASVVLQGQSYTACWRITPLGAHLVYEDGDQGLVPLGMLHEPVNI